jgi:prevent-host-death family protein
MIRATNICSLTEFTRNAKKVVTQVKETRQPYALTVNGEAEVVVQDARSYQEMVDELEEQHLRTALLESELALARGEMLEVDEAFDQIERELGL